MKPWEGYKEVEEIMTTRLFPEKSYQKEFKKNVIFASGHTKLEKNEIIVPMAVLESCIRHEDKNPNAVLFLKERMEKGIYLKNANLRIKGQENEESINLKIVGYYINQVGMASYIDTIYINDQQFDSVERTKEIVALNTKFINNKREDLKLLTKIKDLEYKITTAVEEEFERSGDYVDMVNTFGSVFTPAFGIFSVIMMMNFISISIKTNKKQIGVLRALGMRSSGIFFIFLTEALAVGLLSFLVALIAIFPMAIAVSKIFTTSVMFIQIIIVSIVEIAVMLGLSMAISILGSIIPIMRKAHVLPIKLLKD